jgi:hypothetical protein
MSRLSRCSSARPVRENSSIEGTGIGLATYMLATEARAMGDLAICPVVIRQTDVPDELAKSRFQETRR